MDTRVELQKNDRLSFPGMECTIDRSVGRGSNVIVYVGRYRDSQNPELFHRVLIRELFPYDQKGGISRDPGGSIQIVSAARPLYEMNRRTFLRGNEVHIRLLEKIPEKIDLNINTFEYHHTLYSLIGYTGGRNLYEELAQNSGKDRDTSGTELLLHSVRILKGALDVLQAFHQSGYLHLDISPDNILLIGEGKKERVTLIDYNSVHRIDEIQEGKSVYYSTKDGFTAPEVRMGRNTQIREWTDLYSMTAVLYLLLTGRKLTSAQMIGTAPVGIDPSVSPFLKDCPETVLSLLRRILRRGLAVTPRKRYQKAAQLLEDLTELEDRILGRGITHWALWEAGRERIRRSLKENPALGYLMDEKKIYPLYAETEDGTRIPLLQYNRDPWFHRRSGTETPDHDSKSIPLNPKSRSEESDHESRSEVSDQQQQFRSEGCGQSDHPSCRHAPLLLLGGGGTGKTTALLRLACGQSGRYAPSSTVVYYISLYGYRDREQNYICDRLLESLRFKPQTDSMESARRELLQLLDKPCGKDNCAGHTVSRRSRDSFLFLLDGLNEASGDITPLLEEIHMLAGLAGVRIILTSRSDPGDPLFQKLSLCRLEQTQVRKILADEGILPPDNMEVIDLLSFPLLLSMYIRTVQSGEKHLRLESREQLLTDYFDAILEKEKRDLPADQPFAMGIEAAVTFLLPEIAALIRKKQHSLTGQELLPLIIDCYKDLPHRALTAVYPDWIGHTSELRLGAASADEWYGAAVLGILWKRLGLLVRDENGAFRILHQLIEDHLAEKSRQFHVRFDREKKIRWAWRGIIAGVIVILLLAWFGKYNYTVRRKLASQNEEILKNNEEIRRNNEELSRNRQEILDNQQVILDKQQQVLRNESIALASSSEAKLRSGDRGAALLEAWQALPSQDNERPYVAEAEAALAKALYCYETDRYHPAQTIRWTDELLGCALSENGDYFVTLEEFGKLSCFDVKTGQALWWKNTSFKRERSVFSTVYSEKNGTTIKKETDFPYIKVIEQYEAVFCAGDRETAALYSLSNGKILWSLSESYPYYNMTPHSSDFMIETVDVSADKESFVLGVLEERYLRSAGSGKTDGPDSTAAGLSAGTDDPDVPDAGTDDPDGADAGTDDPDGADAESNDSGTLLYTRHLLHFNMRTGELLSSSGPVEITEEVQDLCSWAGRGTFSDDGRYYVVLHFKEEDLDQIIGMDLSNGKIIRGPSITRPDTGYSLDCIVMLQHVSGRPSGSEAGAVSEDGVFYYCSKYDWRDSYGFIGKTAVGFAATGKNEPDGWLFMRETELPGNPCHYPEMIAFEDAFYLLSEDGALRLGRDGEEDRVRFDKAAAGFARDQKDSSIVYLFNADGTVNSFSLKRFRIHPLAPDYESRGGAAMEEVSRANEFFYTLLGESISETKGFGRAPLPVCLFPDSDSHKAVICSFFEDSRIAVPDAGTGFSKVLPDGDIYTMPDGNGFLSVELVLLDKDENDDRKRSLNGILYQTDGKICDRFSFDPGPSLYSLSSTPMRISSDGSWLYCKDFLYHLKEHRLITAGSLLPEDDSTALRNYCMADLEEGLLSASWFDQSLHLWIDGKPAGTKKPEDDQYHHLPYSLNDSSSTYFRRLTAGSNQLFILCCSQSDHYVSTAHGTGNATDYFLVYQKEEDRWVRIENESALRGFPFVASAGRRPWFAALDESGTLTIYDAAAGKSVQKIYAGSEPLAVKDMRFIMDDRYILVLTSSGSVKYEIFSTENGEKVYTFRPEKDDPQRTDLNIYEDPENSLLYIMNRGGGMTGVCVNTDSWTNMFEIPHLCCVLNDNTCIVCRDHQEFAKYPLYTLGEMMTMAETILMEEGRLPRPGSQ